jgi:hypothetical protein
VWKRWDEAVLSVLRFERSAEWEYLTYVHSHGGLQGRSATCREHGFVTIPWGGGPRTGIAARSPRWLLR